MRVICGKTQTDLRSMLDHDPLHGPLAGIFRYQEIGSSSQMGQIESEFGLTPSSRTRVRMAEPAETRDPFEDYLNRGQSEKG